MPQEPKQIAERIERLREVVEKARALGEELRTPPASPPPPFRTPRRRRRS